MQISKPIEVVAAVIISPSSHSKKCLIVRRGPEQSGAGFWEFPGGKVEVEESQQQALIREIKEELNLDIRVLRFLSENTHSYPSKTIRLFLYLCLAQDPESMKLTEHDLFQWVHPEQIELDQLSEADRPFVSVLLRQQEFFL